MVSSPGGLAAPPMVPVLHAEAPSVQRWVVLAWASAAVWEWWWGWGPAWAWVSVRLSALARPSALRSVLGRVLLLERAPWLASAWVLVWQPVPAQA